MAAYLEPTSSDPVQRLFELSLDMLGTASADGYFTRLNPAWERTLGWSVEELMAEPFISFVHPDDVEATLAQAARLSEAGQTAVGFENRYRTRAGSYRSLEWKVKGDGGILYFVATDVTERNAAAIAGQRAARVRVQGLAVSSFGALEAGGAGLSALFQAAADVLFTALGADMAGIFEHAEDDGAVVRAGAGEPVPPPPVPATESSRRSFSLIRNAGRPLLSADIRRDERFAGPTLRAVGMVSIVAAPIGSATDGFGFVGAASRTAGAFSDDDLAFVQSVANAVSAAVERDRAMARATVGELALRRSEERFRQGFDNAPIGMSLVDPASARYLRVNDAFCTFVGRTADELLTLSVGDVTHPDDGERTGERRYLRPDGTVMWGSVSVSSAFDADGSVDVLFAQVVDITERKRHEESVARQLGEVQWLTEIRDAFDDDRFELHAQPIVDIASGELIQHELLIRMRDRDGGLVPPGDFLPAAEKYGTIKEIDRWVISHGADVAAGGTAVGVNVSGVSLADPTLAAHVERELERTGADPSLLVFEITETALIEAGDMAVQLTRQIREFGCRFALDDFGTGYGGLQHLKTLPLDFLKIDRGFVRTALTSEDDRHLIWAVVGLAKRFGLKTVAEGVEDQATLELLAAMDVDHAQGFHLGRPAPLPDQRRRNAIPVSASRMTRSATSAE